MDSGDKTVTAVILAGGRSTRFGSDKALVQWQGRRLVDHVLDRMPSLGPDPVLVLREEQDDGSWPGATVVHDDPSRHEGPLRGVIRGLAACRTGWAWVVACDQPLVSADLLGALLASATTEDSALIPDWEGRLQPLTGLYATACGPLLEQCCSQGEQSLIGALKTIGFRIFPEDQCRRLDPGGAGFLNINRPGQLAQLEGIET